MKRILRERNALSQYQEDIIDAVNPDGKSTQEEPLVAVYPVDESPDDEKEDDKNLDN
jgi:hypothetical protein